MKSAAKSPARKTGHRTVKSGATYRGVRLQPTYGQSQFTRDEIIRAVEAAIAENPDVFAGKTKT
jgi:hypothetical protein